MTEEALKGLAMQALNMAKTDLRNKRWRGFLLASWHGAGSLHRMKEVEKLINEKAGEGWLNEGAAKDAVFGMLRMVNSLMPPEAFIFVTVVNYFQATAKLQAMPVEAQERLLDGGHDRHHEMVEQGLLTMQDALNALVQTPTLVCNCSQMIAPSGAFLGQPDIRVMPQEHFDGRLKMYGEGKRQAPTPDFTKKM